MLPTEYLYGANIAVWLGIGLYCLLLGRRQARLTARLRRLEESGHGPSRAGE